jgi:hypothetical protein
MGIPPDPKLLDLEITQLLDIWSDWHDFGLLPFKTDDPDGVIPYYKHALRHFDRLYKEAENNVNKGAKSQGWIDQELVKQGKQARKRR